MGFGGASGFGGGSGGLSEDEILPLLNFPLDTLPVNRAVGGWNQGYELAGKNLIDALKDLAITFIAPTVSFGLVSIVQSGAKVINGLNIERGALITQITVSRNVTVNSDTFINSIITLALQATLTRNTLSGNEVFAFNPTPLSAANAGTVSNGIPVYRVTCTNDFQTQANIVNTLDFNFISPIFFGAGAPGTSITTLAKASLSNTRARTGLAITFNNNRAIYAYPSRLGLLTSIKDANNFEYLTGFNRTNEVLNFEDGTSEDYNIYTFNSNISPSTLTFSFS